MFDVVVVKGERERNLNVLELEQSLSSQPLAVPGSVGLIALLTVSRRALLQMQRASQENVLSQEIESRKNHRLTFSPLHKSGLVDGERSETC